MLKETISGNRDRIYRTKQTSVVPFEFNANVVSVFPDMIQRSIPGYDTIVELTGIICANFLGADKRCYDLGCSLGTSAASVLAAIGTRNASIVGVDSSESMIQEAKKRVVDPRVKFIAADIREFEFQSASVVILNFVLQFVPPDDREALLCRILSAMEPDGVLIVSEKISTTDEFDDLHVCFKRFNKYSDLEIAQKRQALEKVMNIDTLDEHLNRLDRTGFTNPRVWFRCLNWVSFLANA